MPTKNKQKSIDIDATKVDAARVQVKENGFKSLRSLVTALCDALVADPFKTWYAVMSIAYPERFPEPTSTAQPSMSPTGVTPEKKSLSPLKAIAKNIRNGKFGLVSDQVVVAKNEVSEENSEEW